MKKVYYLVHFDDLNKENCRLVSPAAVAKAGYVSKALSQIGFRIQIISPALPNKPGKYESSNYEILNGVNLKLFKSFYTNIKIFKAFRRILLYIHLFLFLLFELKKDSIFIVYHSLSLVFIVKILKKIKRIKIISDFNEIYGDVVDKPAVSLKEIRYTKLFNGYFFPSEILAKIINKDHKPQAIIYGNYEIKPKYNESFNDSLVHVVYSGTLSESKGGAAAVKAAEFLDNNYHLHILGFGSDLEVENITRLIDNIKLKTKCKISFEGLLLNEEFDRFLQKCDIGLSTQTLTNNFNNTSFPSKILTYFGNGLKVVSIKIDPVFQSKVSSMIEFYENDSPNDIANAIVRASGDKRNNELSDILKELDLKFKKQVTEVLNKVYLGGNKC